MARRRESGFFWIRRIESTKYKIEINGVDETRSIVEASITPAVIGEESSFRIRLDNNNEAYTALYSGGETVDFYMDFVDGDTRRFRGKIEGIKKSTGDKGDIITLSGTNKYHADLLDVTVTGDFSGTTANNVLKSLIDTYLTGITTANITASTSSKPFKWEDVPFYDAVLDICNSAGFDAYIDADGDFHFFERETIRNDDEAIVHGRGGNMLAVSGLTEDLVDVKNSVKVTSEDDAGLPILYTSEDSSSQLLYGLKEMVIKETNIANILQAQALAEAEGVSEPDTKGKASSFFLPSLSEGDMIWIVKPSQQIHARYRIVKFTHKIPQQTTECTIAKSKDIPLFLKARQRAEAGLSNLKNPHKMKWSYNFPFNDLTDIDGGASSNVTVKDGSLKVVSGTQGIMISDTLTLPSTITEAHLKVVGEVLEGTVYEVSANDGVKYDKIIKEQRIDLSNSGTQLKIKVTLNSASTRIASLAMLVK